MKKLIRQLYRILNSKDIERKIYGIIKENNFLSVQKLEEKIREELIEYFEKKLKMNSKEASLIRKNLKVKVRVYEGIKKERMNLWGIWEIMSKIGNPSFYYLKRWCRKPYK